MSERTCSTGGCGNQNTPHRARIGSGHWCNSCLDWWRRHDGDDPANRSGLATFPAGCVVAEDGERCGRTVVVKRHGWCAMHRSIARRNDGDPTARSRARKGDLLVLARTAAVATTDDCIIPEGWNQRPKIKYGGKQVEGARLVWMLAEGDPGDRDVLHTCNGGSGDHGCINRRHLRLGDAADNAADRAAAGRTVRGVQHWNAVLNESQVVDVRQRYVRGTGPYNRGNTAALAAEFGVSQSAIRRAVRRKTWECIE